MSALVFADSQPGKLAEQIPDGIIPNADEHSLVKYLATRVNEVKARYSEEGEVVHLALSNGKPWVEQVVKGEVDEALTNEDFARLSELPGLRSLLLIRPTVTDDAFAVLQKLPKLRDFRVEYYGSHGVPGQTHRFMLHLNHRPELEALELKHLFRLDGTSVDHLVAMPDLEYLELDVDSAGEEALTFLARCPELKDFELHRTSISDEQIGRIVDHLPGLRRFVIKPGYNPKVTAACLEHLGRLEDLEVVGLHIWRKPGSLPFAGGLEHIAAIPHVKAVEFPGCYLTTGSPEIEKLIAARPDLQLINLKEAE